MQTVVETCGLLVLPHPPSATWLPTPQVVTLTGGLSDLGLFTLSLVTAVNPHATYQLGFLNKRSGSSVWEMHWIVAFLQVLLHLRVQMHRRVCQLEALRGNRVLQRSITRPCLQRAPCVGREAGINKHSTRTNLVSFRIQGKGTWPCENSLFIIVFWT